MYRAFRSKQAAIAAVCACTLLLAGAAEAQQPPAAQPPPPQNLQVLPKDIPRAELTTTMRGFAAALGVQCNYCHVDQPARDMASDAKQTKKTARVMIQMVSHVNETIAAGVGKPAAEVTKVECATCHRGEAVPKNPPPPPPPAPPAPRQ